MLGGSILITGCNRGLGLEMVKQLTRGKITPKLLIATCRKPQEAQELNEVAASNKSVKVIQLDVGDESSYSGLVSQVGELVGSQGLNLLINNAGVAPKSTRINMVKWKQMADTFAINTIAPLMLTKALLPHLKTASAHEEGNHLSVKRAAVINISSILASIEYNDNGGLYPYRSSKTALNAVTKSLSIDLRDHNILVSTLHPGWVKTDMGGKNAPLTPTESISQLLNTVAQLNELHHGQFIQYDGEQLPW